MEASTHLEIAQLLKDAVKHIMLESKETAEAAPPQVTSTTDSKPAVRGTRLEVKDVCEVYVINLLDYRPRELIT